MPDADIGEVTAAREPLGAELTALLYRCRYAQLVGAVERHPGATPYERARRLSLKASALFEMHQVRAATATLASLAVLAERDGDDACRREAALAAARLAYVNDRHDHAAELVAPLLDQALDLEDRVRAWLLVGNLHYTLGRPHELATALRRLDAEPLDDRPWLALSRCILHGNAALTRPALGEARAQFRAALRQASRAAWPFFQQRALHGLARVARADGNAAELACLLGVLRDLVDEGESLYMAHVINADFPESAVAAALGFDDALLRIRVRGAWQTFHERPLLYQFLRLLHERPGFIQKEEIVGRLWPGEAYNPLVHDARVYDVARRARSMIEASEEQPVILLSGRSGYRLASENDA